MDRSKVSVGQEVAFNNLDDATWFAVEEINGFVLTVRKSGTNFASQRIDVCAVKRVRPGS